MGTTFCKKKYVRAIESFAQRFFKGDVFEVIEERDGLYFVILSGEYVRSGWMKKRFEEIPNPNIINKETPMTTPLKIEVGKYYKTRGGLKAGPMKESYGTLYHFYCDVENDENERIFMGGGTHGCPASGIKNKPVLDLIEEWVEPIVDFKVGDIIMNPMKPSNNRKEVLLVTEGYYFLRDLVTLSEHSVKKSQIDGNWTLAPPPPKVTKLYYRISSCGNIFYQGFPTEERARTNTIYKNFSVLEITVIDDNGKLTTESRIIPV